MVIMQETKYICIAIKIENKYRNNFLILYKHIIYNISNMNHGGTIANAPKTMKEKTDEFNQILHHYLESNPHIYNDRRNAELEIRFGTNTRIANPISKIDYDNVVKQLLSCGFVCDDIDGIQYLRIQCEFIDKNTGQTRMSNIRAEISGTAMIQQYCLTNDIEKLKNMPSTTANKLKFTQKSNAMTASGQIIKKLDMEDFNFRVSYQIEQDYNMQSPISKDIMNEWQNKKKMFRCLNRVRFRHPDYPVFADLSIVKSSKQTNRVPIPEYDIAKAGVFSNAETYEIELEIDNSRTGTGSEFNNVKTLMDSVRKCIRIVLSGIQMTKYPISFSERDVILDSYMKLIHEEDSETTTHNVPRRRIRPSDFMGPSSVTLQVENIQETNKDSSNVICVRENYTVTEKADGERKLMYINEDGKIYLIDTNMNVMFTGVKTNDKTLFSSLLDGEHIRYDKNGNFIDLYAAFDIYFIHKKSVRHFEFYPQETVEEEIAPAAGKKPSGEETPDIVKIGTTESKHRLILLNYFIQMIKPVSILETSTEKKIPSDFRIQAKNFWATSKDTSIFSACSSILSRIDDGTFEYNTDGLIFTPTNLAVGATSSGAPPSRVGKATWNYSFKWKPAEYNTIDFLVSIKKDKTGRDAVYNVFQDGKNLEGTQNVVQYKTLILRCGFNEKTDGYINPFQDLINDTRAAYGENDNEDAYKPVPFQPTNPYDPNACFCNIELKGDGNKLFMLTEENQYFDQDMIVEFKYVSSNADGWKWVPLRVRYDKTADLNAGRKNYGNSYKVANSNWHSIHYPIEQKMICTGENIPELVISEEVYYNRGSEETSTQAMRDFHNLFVKKNLILSVAKRGNTLIDYAVGKAGDMSKWTMSHLKFVFGIDISKDNIHNRMDGACARYLTARKRSNNLFDALFVNGDSRSNIRNGDAFPTEKDKQIAKAVFGMGAKDESLLGKGVYRQYGVAESGFNVSSCQFALHYFFENKTTFHNFMRNIAECTKIGGYFIGTCYDGKKVFDLLRKKQRGESFTIMKNERKIFEIIKEYDETGFPDEDMSLGYAINVYQESINQLFREYLVNFDYLVRIMEDYGFEVLRDDEAKSMSLTHGTGMFEELHKMMEQEIKQRPNRRSDYKSANFMSSEEKTISFLNRYFIFKKIRSENVKKMSEVILKQAEFIEKVGEESLRELEKTIISAEKIEPPKITKKKLRITLKNFVPPKTPTPSPEEEKEPEKEKPTVEPVVAPAVATTATIVKPTKKPKLKIIG